MRRLLLALALVSLAATAHAQNANLGKVSATEVELRGRTAVAAAGTNRCKIYYNTSTQALTATCDGSTGRTLLGFATVACVEDGSGNLLCNSFSAVDQNTLNPPAANRFRLYDNDVDLNPDPTCANYGQAGIETILDVDESANDLYVVCDGTTEVDVFEPSAQVLALYVPSIVDSSPNQTAVLGGTNDMFCQRYVPLFTKTVTKYSANVATIGGANQTAAICVYSDSDAASTLLADMGRITVHTSTGVRTSSAVTAFTLRRGTTYRVCYTSNDTSMRLSGSWNNALVSDAGAPIYFGQAANDSTGTTSTLACPTATGALTRSANAPVSLVLQ